jgi:serine/threonine protein kinase
MPTTAAAPQVLDGKYRLEQVLGRGGMGVVRKAIHLGTTRTVVVKLIAPRFGADAEFLERFRREAAAAGRLRHPNVVDVTDFGFAETSSGPVAYLVMEYLDGCSLEEVLRQDVTARG